MFALQLVLTSCCLSWCFGWCPREAFNVRIGVALTFVHLVSCVGKYRVIYSRVILLIISHPCAATVQRRYTVNRMLRDWRLAVAPDLAKVGSRPTLLSFSILLPFRGEDMLCTTCCRVSLEARYRRSTLLLPWRMNHLLFGRALEQPPKPRTSALCAQPLLVVLRSALYCRCGIQQYKLLLYGKHVFPR